MNFDEVVGEVVQRYGRRMVLDLPRESVRESSVAPHRCSHAPILPLNKTCADMVRVLLSDDRNGAAPDTLPRIVARFGFAVVPVELDQHCIVHFGTKRTLNGFQIGAVTIAR